MEESKKSAKNAPLILVVEDNRQSRLMYEEFLIESRYRVIAVPTAEQALIKLLENEIDLVVLDYRLPDVNGIHVLQSIRKKNQNLPVVMVTAVDDEATVKEALAEGATLYLTKPVQRAEFLAVIQNALEKYTLREPPSLA